MNKTNPMVQWGVAEVVNTWVIPHSRSGKNLGKYLATLTPAQEDRVLTTPMASWPSDNPKVGCLVMVVEGLNHDPNDEACLAQWNAWHEADKETRGGRPLRYDALCDRVGIKQANALIRNRILSNQARRALTPVLVLAATSSS